MCNRIAIGLGSNLGNRLEFIRIASQRVANELLKDVRVSSVYESEPWGIKDQPDFLNAVLVGQGGTPPPAILEFLMKVEAELGRTPSKKNASRVIDLDLLAYGDRSWNAGGIEVPHPRMMERDFVLIPFVEVWKDWQHPIEKKSISVLLEEFRKANRMTARFFAASPVLQT